MTPLASVGQDVDGLVGAVADHESFVRFLVDYLPRLLDVKAASVLLEDDATGKLLFLAATGEEGQTAALKKIVLDPGEGIAGWVMRTGEATLSVDVAADERWSSRVAEAVGVATTSIAAAPLVEGETVIGVLEAVDKTDGSPLAEADLARLTTLAELVSVALAKSKALTRARTSIARLTEELRGSRAIVGVSPAIKKAIDDAVRVAGFRSTALLTGASGVGKELFARLIHERSDRAAGPLVTVNCGALPETLLERELFGHEQGAFTGADARRPGLFEAADGGTIFLDEIGETSPAMQVKLLRVLQEGAFARLGGQEEITVDVRVVAATNRNLEKMVEEKTFRGDLYYRLNVFRIHLPSLAERREDIPALAEAHLERLRHELGRPRLSFTPAALAALSGYRWPGNIRQLQNAVERAAILSDTDAIGPEGLPDEVAASAALAPAAIAGLSLKEAQTAFRKEYVERALAAASGNRSKAAKALGVQRTYLSRLARELGIGE
jgi:Nif-specific regulatory protein